MMFYANVQIGGVAVDWLTDEVLFYGGLILTGTSLAAAAVFFIISHIQWVHLSSQLDAEYGERKEKKGEEA